MANFFSTKLYFQGLKKIRISGTAFALIIILLNAFLPIIGIIDSANYSSPYHVASIVDYNLVVPFCMLVIVLVPILAHDMFSFLNERNQSDFYHSIPQKRTCVYVSFTAAVLTWAFGTIIASTLVNTILWSLASSYSFSLSTIILGMLPFLVLSVQMAGVMILAMTVTGTKISNFLVAILFFLFFRAMSTFCVTALDEVSNVININYGAYKYFGLEFFLPFSLLLGIFDGEAGVFVDAKLQFYSLFVGILFLVIGGFAYKNRRSESASKSAPSKLLQHVYRFAVTLPFVFMVAFFMMIDGIEGYQIILALVAVLVYVLYELITTKKLKSVVKTLPLMIIPVLVTVLMVSGIYISRNAIYNDRFTTEEFDSFCFTSPYLSSYESYMVEEVFVKSDRAGEILSDALNYSLDGGYNYQSTTYERVLIKLKSGRIMARNLHIPDSEYVELDNILYNSPDYCEAYLQIPHPDEISNAYCRHDMSDAQVKRLYRIFYEEYNSLSTKDKLRVKKPQGDYVSVSGISLSGYLNGVDYSAYYQIVFDYMPKTAVAYMNMLEQDETEGYVEFGMQNAINQLSACRSQLATKSIDYAYGALSFAKVTGRFSDGSIERIYKYENPKMVDALYDVLILIADDKNSYVYTDPSKIYKLNFHLDVNLVEDYEKGADTTPIVVKPYHTSADLVGISSVQVVPDTETVYYDTNFYINEDVFVSISDENMAKIEAIMQRVYGDADEKTVKTEE